MRILLLGGTGEARRLADTLSRRPDLSATISFAGRTEIPLDQPITSRVGGFGGVDGLRRYLRGERIERVVDATHPFAARISANAARACDEEGIPLSRLSRPAWRPGAGDRWVSVGCIAQAVAALGPAPRRVLLTIGRTEVHLFGAAPQHNYLVRSIGAPDRLPSSGSRVLLDRPPFTVESEETLMREAGVDILVSKNSGGEATAAKLVAARRLAFPVVMIERPNPPPGGREFLRIEEVVAWLDRPQPERGV